MVTCTGEEVASTQNSRGSFPRWSPWPQVLNAAWREASRKLNKMARKPPPTLALSDLGEDSHTSQGTPKAPSLLGLWPRQIQIPTPRPMLWNHFRHTVQLLTMLGSQASGSDGSGCQLFIWGETKPKLRSFPVSSHLKGLSQVRGRTFIDTFVEGISMLKSAGICPVSISSARVVGQVVPQGLARLFLQSGLPHAPTLCAGLAAHLLFTVLPLLSQAPLPPKVSQLCVHTDDKNTTNYRTGRALSRSDSQGDKWQCYHTRTHEHTHSHNRNSCLSGLQETSSAGSAQDRGGPCASLHTCRPQWWYHHWGVCAPGPSISVAVLQTTPIS